MERIHKIIITILGVIVLGIMVVGIVFSATRGEDIDKVTVKFQGNTVTTTSKPTTTTTSSATTTTSQSVENTTTSSATTTTTEAEKKPVEFNIQAMDLNLNEGDSGEIQMELGEGLKASDLSFSSSDESVCTVDESGKVTAIMLGECKIDIKYENESVNIKVTVSDNYGTVAVEKRRIYTSGCNFREGPDTSYGSMGTFATNTEVEIIGENDNWWKVNYDGKLGFVRKDVVSDTKY